MAGLEITSIDFGLGLKPGMDGSIQLKLELFQGHTGYQFIFHMSILSKKLS
jgi:hypothetical protein